MFKANQKMNKKLFTNDTCKTNIKRSHLTLCYKQKKRLLSTRDSAAKTASNSMP